MHIAMLSAEFPPRWGGMGSTVFHLSAALVNRGHKVTVITRSGAGKPPHQEGVEVIEVGWARIPMEFTRSYGRRAISELERLNERLNVDVVHLHCPMISWATPQFHHCIQNIAPVVSSLHGSWLGERDGLLEASMAKEAAVWANVNDIAIRLSAERYAKFESIAIRESSICVANSRATKEDFDSRYNPPPNWDCEVIHWGVDTEMFRPLDIEKEEEKLNFTEIRKRFGAVSPGSKLILAVGRLAARKGYSTLIRGFSALNEEMPNTKLVIVGRGHLKRRLMRLAKSLGVEEDVRIESSLSFAELAQLYRYSDLVVFPSFYVGHGLIPLEAMASGVPVVTVDHGPLPEMVDESVGALFTMGNIESMVSVMREVLKTGREKGEQGRARVLEKFTYSGNAESFEKVYIEAIKR